MTDLAPQDAQAVALEVQGRLADALAAAGVDGTNPEVRRAVLELLAGARPPDRRLTAAEKAAQALQHRRDGFTYREIVATGLYASPGGAQKAVMKALSAIPREPAEQVRQLAIERLEHLLAGSLYRKAQGLRGKPGDPKPTHKEQMDAIDRVLQVMREERRYIPGVEVPVNAELTGAGGGAIVVELSIPSPVHVDPVPQAKLGGIVDLPPTAITAGADDDGD